MIKKPLVAQVERRLDTLPAALRSYIFSMEITELGEKIGLARGLKEADVPYLAEVIAWVMMGFVQVNDAAAAIKDYVQADDAVATALAQDLNVAIFSKFKSALDKIYAPLGQPTKPAALEDRKSVV